MLVVNLKKSATESVLDIWLAIDFLKNLFERSLEDTSLRRLLVQTDCRSLDCVSLTRPSLAICEYGAIDSIQAAIND